MVVGEGAGAAKLATIKTKGIATLDEDGFLNLIRTRQHEPDEAMLKKEEQENQKIKAQAAALEKKEREEEALRKRKEAALEGTGIAAK